MHEFFAQISDKMKNAILQPIPINRDLISFIHLGKFHNFSPVYGTPSSHTFQFTIRKLPGKKYFICRRGSDLWSSPTSKANSCSATQEIPAFYEKLNVCKTLPPVQVMGHINPVNTSFSYLHLHNGRWSSVPMSSKWPLPFKMSALIFKPFNTPSLPPRKRAISPLIWFCGNFVTIFKLNLFQWDSNNHTREQQTYWFRNWKKKKKTASVLREMLMWNNTTCFVG